MTTSIPQRKGATVHTKKKNAAEKAGFDPKYFQAEAQDIEELDRHFLWKLGRDDLKDASGQTILNRHAQDYLYQDAPDTVNPYLWDIAQVGTHAGILELVKGKVYYTYGITSAGVGFIRSDHGWIVQESGGNVNEGELSLRLFESAIGEDVRSRIKALIISHTHQDHFGGASVFAGEHGDRVPVYGPAGYEHSLINDNLYAGIAMSRRLQYQCGLFLPHDEKGYITLGLATTLGVRGPLASVFPTVHIDHDQTVTIDGVAIDFLLTPDTETEAHLMSYYRPYHALFLADNAVGTIHNTYTMRGAPVRDANYWGRMLYELCRKYENKAEVVFCGHGIPHWNTPGHPDAVRRFLLDNAAAYKFTSDQALLLANKGCSLNEVGQQIQIPDSIRRTWYTRPHYGDYTFNARGAFQKYLGFYDGNPVNLLPLPEKDYARKFIEYAGSAEAVLEKLKRDFDQGEYQWVATVAQYLVFNDPENLEARCLCADALEQLGYQTENGLWRNAYLSAALELRNPGFAKSLNIRSMDNRDTVAYVSPDLLLDHLGINFDGYLADTEASKAQSTAPAEYAAGKLEFLLQITNGQEIVESHVVSIYKGTVFHMSAAPAENVPAEKTLPVIQTTREGLYQLSVGQYAQNQERFVTDRRDILEWLSRYVVDTSVYRNYNLIEPLETL